MVKVLSESPEIYIFSDGFASIDGGAMFGIVPKVFWQKHYSADEKNRVDIALNCMLINVNDTKVLIDTGIGDKFESKYTEIYKIRKKENLVKHLKGLGLQPDDIDIVILTHLHFDHCGYNTVVDNGVIKPLFRKARYIVQKSEWEYSVSPDERSAASYIKENFLPLDEFKVLELIDDDIELKDLGIKIIYTGGHSVGHQSVLVLCDDKKIFFAGDLFPVGLNLKVNYTSSFDLFPLNVIKKKKEILKIAEQENWVFVLPHEIQYPYGTLQDLQSKFSQQ
ncbi:MAG: MBL fold metallo-hydrolase [Endomicrobia bacterium]|nr:MBL fold metallo-hydrolase [Endomicrobiia bacterium]